MSRFLYADHAATTALSPRALEAMMPYFRDAYGNPSSLYAFGQQAKSDLDAARAEVARCLNAKPEEIFFTSGGTESDNWALKAVAELRGGKGTDREELTDFLAALYQGYTDFYQGQVPTAAQRMREVWFYLIHLFDDAEKLNKQLRRFRTPAEYERIQAEILASCPIRSNVQGDLI